MIKYITYKESGEIIGGGVCPEAMLHLQAIPEEGIMVMRSHADWQQSYVHNDLVLKMPTKPADHCIFDYSVKRWIDPRTLAEQQTVQWQLIKQARDTAEFGSFVWDGSRFDCDAVSQSRIRSAAQEAALSPAFARVWTLADNSTRVLNAADMVAVAAALDAHVDAQHALARELRLQISAATNAEQLADMHWPVPVI